MLRKVTFALASLSLLFPSYVMAATAAHTTTQKTHKSSSHHAAEHFVPHKSPPHTTTHAGTKKYKTTHHHTKAHAKSKKAHHLHHAVTTKSVVPNDTFQVSENNGDDSAFTQKSLFSLNHNRGLASLAGKTVENLRRTTYKFGGNDFDPSRGIYRLDCSAYVNNLLQTANPNAYATLAEWSRTYKPNSSNYYEFFNQLPSSHWHYWHKVNDVNQLNGGDILVFRYGHLKQRHAGGHVMVVMNKPQTDPMVPNVFWVSVADSAASGHSDDTRPIHTSGVGIGKLLLKINPYTKQVDAYAWKAGSNWKSNTRIVMASPENKNSLS